MSKTDAQLVRETLEGDRKAFEEIITRYQRLVFNIAYHYLGTSGEVEDLAQEVFLKVYQALDRFDTSRSLKSWVARITANRCLDELRRARRRKLKLFSDLSSDEEMHMESFFEKSMQGVTLTEMESQQSFELLQRILNQLNEKDKMAFVLREMEDLSYAELAEAFKTTELAVRIRVSRVRRRLQEEFRKRLLRNRVGYE